MKRNPLLTGEFDEFERKLKSNTKKLKEDKAHTFIFNYSKSTKEKKNIEHSKFIDEYSMQVSNMKIIWDKTNPCETIKLNDNFEKRVSSIDSDNDDILCFIKERIKVHKKEKQYIKESLYKKKRGKRKTREEKNNSANEKIMKALHLRDKGYSSTYISKFLGIKISQINNAVYKRSLELEPILKGKGAPEKLNNEHKLFLKSLLKKDPSKNNIFNYLDLLRCLTEKFCEFRVKQPSLSTIVKYTKKLGYSKKKISKRNENSFNNSIKLMRKDIIKQMVCLQKSEKNVIYIDETHFNLEMIPHRAISKKNTKALVKGKN